MTPERLAQLAANYNTAFPQFSDSHLIASDRWVRGVWTLGNDYRNLSTLYGAYPPAYLKRVGAMFPSPRRVLHLFSGSLPATVPGIRVDSVADRSPSVIGDAVHLPFLPETFDLTMADPPYSADDAQRYNTPMVDRRKALRDIAAVSKPGAVLIWLDTVLPMFAKRNWHWFGDHHAGSEYEPSGPRGLPVRACLTFEPTCGIIIMSGGKGGGHESQTQRRGQSDQRCLALEQGGWGACGESWEVGAFGMGYDHSFLKVPVLGPVDLGKIKSALHSKVYKPSYGKFGGGSSLGAVSDLGDGHVLVELIYHIGD